MNLYLFIPISNARQSDFIFNLLAHSITMTLAFLTTDIIKTRYKTLHVDKLINISNKVWILLLITSLCITAIPGSIGFIAELQALYSANKSSSIVTAITMVSIILSSCYMMYACFKVKDKVYKYNLFKFNNWQITVITAVFVLIITGGILPLLYVFKY